MVLSPNCAMIKFVESNQNSPGGNATEKCQESQDIMSPRILPRKIYQKKKKMLGDLSPQRDPKVQEIHAV